MKSGLRQRDQRITELESVAREVQDLRSRLATETAAREKLESEADELSNALESERQAKRAAELAQGVAEARASAIELLFEKLEIKRTPEIPTPAGV